MAIDRTNYNALVEDDGSNTVGSLWDKVDIKDVILDPIDAAFLPIIGGTLTGDLKFTDGTYDLGKSGATRPRDGFFSRNVVAGGTLNVGGDLTVQSSANTMTLLLKNTIGAGQGDVIFALDKAATGNSAYLIYRTGGSDRWQLGTGIVAIDDNFRLRNAGGIEAIKAAYTTGLLTFGAYTATTWASGDKYLVVDASGNVHRSAIGPAS